MKISEENALYRLAAYCSRAERCEFDLRRKMTSWELEDLSQDRIIKRLKSERFLDHQRYAKSFVNDKFKYNKWGEKKIIFELRRKMIAEEDYLPFIEELDKSSIEEQLVSILRTKNKTVKAKDDYDKKTKLIRFALGRGFSMDVVIKCVDSFVQGKYDDEDF